MFKMHLFSYSLCACLGICDTIGIVVLVYLNSAYVICNHYEITVENLIVDNYKFWKSLYKIHVYCLFYDIIFKKVCHTLDGGGVFYFDFIFYACINVCCVAVHMLCL